jgi:hypothetical protein
MKIALNIFYYIRSCIAVFVLEYILGWKFKQSNNVYIKHQSGKYVAIYLHTSIYDHLIGVLFSYAFNLKFITIGAYRSKKDIQQTNIKYLIYNLFDTILVDPHKNKQTTCEDIIRNLHTKENYVFSINPEGSIYRTSGFKSGFYKISKSIKSDILLFDLDYNKHEVDLKKIIDSNIVLTAPYDRIIEIVSEEMTQSIPFHSGRTFLISDKDSNVINKPTSLININCSLLRFIPLICVLSIGVFHLYPSIF